MVFILVFLSFSIIAFFLRITAVLIYRSYFRKGFVGDASIHLGIIEQLNKNVFSKKVDKYVVPNPMWYPIAFHHFAWLFPFQLIKRKPYIPNLIVFSIMSGFFMTYVYYIQEEVFGFEGNIFLIFTSVVFFISISNFIFAGPEIAYIKLTERLFARMTCAFYYLSIVVYMIWENNASLFLAILFGGITLSAAMFSRQVIFFSIPFLCLLFFSLMPLIILVGNFAVGVLLYRKYFVKSIYYNFKSWGMYGSYYNKESKTQISYLSKLISVRDLISEIKKKSISGIEALLVNFEPSRTILRMPELILFLILSLYYLNESVFFIKAFVPLLLVYFLTSTKMFHQFGEPYRYFEYGGYFLIPFFISYQLVIHEGIAKFALIQYIEVIFVLFLFFIFKLFKNKKNISTDNLQLFLRKINIAPESIVFPVSMQIAGGICERSNCKSFWWQPGGIAEPTLYREYIEVYPYLRKDWKALFAKHKVTHVIASKQDLKKIDWQYDFSGLDFIYEDQDYVAYSVPPGYLQNKTDQSSKSISAEKLDEVIGYRTCGKKNEIIKSVNDSDAPSLPQTIVVLPGKYKVFNNTYELLIPGNYYFISPLKFNRQAVILDKEDPVSSALLLSNLIIRGNHDDLLSVDELKEKSSRQFVVTTCNKASQLVNSILAENGFKSRIVKTITNDKFNSFNDGHVMLEVFSPGFNKYILIDCDKKSAFKSKEGNYLNLLEFCSLLNAGGGIEIKHFNSGTKVSWSDFVDRKTGFNYQFIENLYNFSDENLLEVYRRICAVPYIAGEDGRNYGVILGEKFLHVGFDNIVFITPDEFEAQFYL